MYLSITSGVKQKRISLGFTIKEEEFNLKTQKIVGSIKRHKDLQLMIDNIEYHFLGDELSFGSSFQRFTIGYIASLLPLHRDDFFPCPVLC